MCCAQVPKSGVGPTAAALVCKHASRSGRSEEYPLRVRAANTPPFVLSRRAFAFWVIAAAWCPPSAAGAAISLYARINGSHQLEWDPNISAAKARKKNSAILSACGGGTTRFRSAHLHVGELLPSSAPRKIVDGRLTQTVRQASPIDRGYLGKHAPQESSNALVLHG